MAQNINPIFELVPISTGVTIVAADTTTPKTVITAGGNGSRIDAIIVCSDDTSAVNLAFYIGTGVADLYIGNVLVPIGSGYTTVVKVDAMATLYPVGQTYIQLAPGYTLKCNAVVTITAAKTVTIVAIGGDF